MMIKKRYDLYALLLLVFVLILSGCSDVSEVLNPDGAISSSESLDGSASNNLNGSGSGNHDGGNSGDASDPNDILPGTGLFAVTLRASQCDYPLPETVELEIESLEALTSDEQWISPSPPISGLTVNISCSGQTVTLTAPDTHLPEGDYLGLKITIIGAAADGEPIPLPVGGLSVMVSVNFSIDANGSASIIELELNLAASFIIKDDHVEFNPTFVAEEVYR